VGKALILLGVAIGAGLLVYWLAGPHGTAPPGGSSQTAVAATPSARGASATDTASSTGHAAPSNLSTPIEPPRSPEQREREERERRRADYYAQLRREAGNALLAIRPSDDDPATLELYAGQDDPQNIAPLLNTALHANAYFYGFRHIRYYAPNPPQEVERYRLEAEANADPNGDWHTFQK
jgi:hypothetical protein